MTAQVGPGCWKPLFSLGTSPSPCNLCATRHAKEQECDFPWTCLVEGKAPYGSWWLNLPAKGIWRERGNTRPTSLKIKRSVWVPFPQQVKLLQCLICLWFQSRFNSISAKGAVGKNFCSIINFPGRSDMRLECIFFLFSSYFVTCWFFSHADFFQIWCSRFCPF